MRTKTPVRLATLGLATTNRKIPRPRQGDLPRTYSLYFGEVSGPGNLDDGRDLRAVLTPDELARVLEATPAVSLDTGSLMALARITDLLRGKGPESRFTGVRVDDLATLLTATDDDPAPAAVLERLREAAGLQEASAHGAD